MNKQEAFQFVHNVLDTIVVEANCEKLANFYHTNAILHIQDLSFTFSDILNRIQHNKTAYLERQHHLEEVIVVNDLIIFQDKQTLIRKDTNEIERYIITGTYQLEKDKIKSAWLICNKNIDYLQKPQKEIA